MSQPLDFARPLWQLYLIEGLEGKRHAVISKTHHALVDGVSAVDVGTIMLDPNPEGTEMEVSEEPWDPDEPSPEMLLVRAASERVRRPLRRARKAAQEALTMPRETAGRVMRTAEGFAGLAAGGPSAPKTFLNARDRARPASRLRWRQLDQLKAGARRREATVNDVILAVATGALRRIFERRGEAVPDQLVALVPMCIRRPDEQHDLGNRIATLMVALPLGERDPGERLEGSTPRPTRLKRSEQARAASLVIEATGWAPPTINRVLVGGDVAAADLEPGDLERPRAAGALLPAGERVREIYPFVPLSPQGHALSIGVVSYDGGVFFGLAGDRDVLADLDELAADIEARSPSSCAAGELLADRHRRPGRHVVDQGADVAISGANAAVGDVDAEGARRPVDRNPVAPDPARRQLRLDRGQRHRATAVGRVEVAAEGVGDGESPVGVSAPGAPTLTVKLRSARPRAGVPGAGKGRSRSRAVCRWT